MRSLPIGGDAVPEWNRVVEDEGESSRFACEAVGVVGLEEGVEDDPEAPEVASLRRNSTNSWEKDCNERGARREETSAETAASARASDRD